MPKVPSNPPHGIKRFRSRTYLCRCVICRAAQASYMRGYRLTHTSPSYPAKPRKERVLTDFPHGFKRYRSPRFKCRCSLCRAGHAAKTMEERKALLALHSTPSS